MNKILSVVIPTFNRHKRLLKTLNALNSCDGKYEIDIIIIDNCSDPSVEDYINQQQFSSIYDLSIFKNEANIGLGANLVLSISKAKNEWIWLLGDDDTPISDALDKIFHETHNVNKNTFLIKYNSDAGGWPNKSLTIKDEKEFVDFCSNIRYYSNILFISNGIFRRKHILQYAQEMMNYSQTMAPQIIGILHCLKNKYEILVLNDLIVEHGRPNREEMWDNFKLKEGFLNFRNVTEFKEFKHTLMPLVLKHYLVADKSIINIIRYPLKYAEFDYYYWKWFFDSVKSILNFKYKLFIQFVIIIFLPLTHKLPWIKKIISMVVQIEYVKNNGRN